MKVDRAIIIRRLGVSESLEYAQMCADSCDKYGVPYEFLDGVEFMNSEDAIKSVGAWLHPENVRKKVSQGNNCCHASHIKSWRRIVEIGKPCLILEHDTFVKGDVCNIEIPDMTVVTFGHRIAHPDWYNPPNSITELIKIETQSGAHAYAVSPKTAQWLIDDAVTNGVNINVDEWLNLRCGLPLYVAEPPQVVCWPRMSTREWIKPEEKRLSPGSSWSFASSNTPGWTKGFKVVE